MLQFFRDRLSSVAAVLLLGLLVIPFAFVGVNSYFQTNVNNDVATVNGEPITAAEFQTSFQNYLRQIQSLTGANFDLSQYDQPIARRSHLDRMIDQRVMEMYAQEAGLAVSTEELAQKVMEIEVFQIDGQFDPDIYRNILAAQAMTPSQFERQMAADLVRVQLPQAIMGSAIATRSELELIARLQGQTRSFRALPVPASEFTDGVSVSEAEINEYFEQNRDRFMSEEQVIIEYLELDAADFNQQVEVDEEELKARYESQESRFINPESRLASHILLTVPEDADEATEATIRQSAEDLIARIKAGEEFEALAAEYSADAGSAADGGDLGWLEPGVMVTAFEDALYAMSAPGISEPVRTAFGFHIIKLREIRPAEGMSFEEARPQLLEEYQSEMADRMYLDQADRLVDLVYEDDTTLEPAAAELGLPILQTGPFGRDGGAGIAANQDIIDAAFSDLVVHEGAASDAIDIGPNHIVVLRVIEHLPSVQQELEEVRETILAELQEQAASDAAEAYAAELVQALEANETDLETAATEREQELIIAENAVRRDFQYGVELVDAVFKLPAAESLPALHVVAMGPDFAVVELQAVTDGTLEENDPAQLQYQRTIANSTGSSEQSGLLAQLRAQADIEVFEAQINRGL